MIALRNGPLETGVMKCWKCWGDFPLDAFEPMAGGRYGRRRTCRRCRQPVYERYERKRRERRCLALERRIATMPAGPELDILARKVLDGKVLRHVRALACRLKAGTYQLDAEGRPIIPSTLKPWADRLNVRQAESFCRRKLGLPRLPGVRRSPYPTFAEIVRASLKRFRAEGRLRQQQRRIDSPDVESRPGRGWTIEDERRHRAQLDREARFDRDEEPDHQFSLEDTGTSRTMQELYFEQVMSAPPPTPQPLEPETQPKRPTQSEGAVGNNPFPAWVPKI